MPAPRRLAQAIPPRFFAMGLAALSLAGCGSASHPAQRQSLPAGPVQGAASLARRFDGVSQHGMFLGSDRAPYTLVEFADLQCPFCARFDRDVLPGVIDRFVRSGRLRLELRVVALIGPQSRPAGAATLAAAEQDRAWQFADLFYRNQLRENSGYVTRPFVARIASAVPGLDVARLHRELRTARFDATLVSDNRSAATARISGTPGFRLGRTGDVLEPFQGLRLERADFVRRLESAMHAG